MIDITLNGKPETVEETSTVSGVLESKRVNLGRVAVELNRRILRREEYATTLLAEGDALEVVTFVGGG